MYEDGNADDNEANVNATRGVAPMQAPKNGARAWNYFDPYDPPDKGPNVGNKRYRRCKFCKIMLPTMQLELNNICMEMSLKGMHLLARNCMVIST